MSLPRSLLAGFAFCCFLAPASALVEPEVEAWSVMVEDVRQACQLPGSELLPEALEELGGLGSALAKAPLEGYMAELELRRGLKFKYYTPWHIKNRIQLRAWLQQQLAKEYSPKKVDQIESTLKALALVPPDFKFLPFIESLLTGQVAGAYDPVADQFFLVDVAANRSLKDKALERTLASAGLSMGDQTSVLAIHELDHALGGQHFGLKSVIESLVSKSTDQQMAAQCLIEGDATFVMMDHQKGYPAADAGEKFEFLGAEQIVSTTLSMLANSPVPLPGTEGLDEAPLYFQKSLLGPYMYGAEFVSTLRHAALDWSAVNTAYSKLPDSMEQILHPDSYIYVSTPANIPNFAKLPDTLGPWKKVVDDTGGEFMLRTVLEEAGVDGYVYAAEGWDGDRLRIYRHEATLALAFFWAINWDTAADAVEFESALGEDFPFAIEAEPQATYLSSGFSKAEQARLRSAL